LVKIKRKVGRCMQKETVAVFGGLRKRSRGSNSKKKKQRNVAETRTPDQRLNVIFSKRIEAQQYTGGENKRVLRKGGCWAKRR